MTVLPGL